MVVLGSGTPIADAQRSGPALSIAVDETAHLVDAGAGVLARLEAARRAGHPALAPERLSAVFITHLHSDHTLGLDELLIGAWVLGREEPLHVWGPPGIGAMIENIREGFSEDHDIRTGGLEGLAEEGSRAVVHEIDAPGVVHRGPDLTVRAFEVAHGSWEHAFGYRFDGPDRSVVVSGDTAPTDAVVEACDGCDVLVHEVYSATGWRRGSDSFRAYHASFHTSGEELGRIAARARPGLLVLTHVLAFGETPETLIREVRGAFDGPVELAVDLAAY